MRRFLQERQLALFVLIAYAVSWADWLPMALRGASVTPGGPETHFPGLLGPALAAFTVVAITDGWAGIGNLAQRLILIQRPYGQFWIYTLSPLIFLALALFIMIVLGHPLPSLGGFGLYSGLPPLNPILIAILVLLFNGFGEETGWRGFALPRLQAKFGPFRGALILALIWAGWHVPSFWFVEGYRNMSMPVLIGGFGVGIVAASIVLARVSNRTGGSVLAVAMWHAIYNFTSATSASRDTIAAVTTSCVMLWAVGLVLLEWLRPQDQSRLLVRKVLP
jgi:membrane protease YdiL (CAAX protease family)